MPSWKLVVPCGLTQLVGTLIAVYGWLIAPTGWRLALMVWGYALASFMVASAIKVGMDRLLAHGVPWHLARVEQHVST